MVTFLMSIRCGFFFFLAGCRFFESFFLPFEVSCRFLPLSPGLCIGPRLAGSSALILFFSLAVRDEVSLRISDPLYPVLKRRIPPGTILVLEISSRTRMALRVLHFMSSFLGFFSLLDISSLENPLPFSLLTSTLVQLKCWDPRIFILARLLFFQTVFFGLSEGVIVLPALSFLFSLTVKVSPFFFAFSPCR